MSDKPKQEEVKNTAQETVEEFPHVNRGFAITVISLFVAFLILPTLIWGALSLVNKVNPAIMETLNFDTGENRAFATFPDSFDPQTFTSEVESWYNDNLPFRSILYKTQETLENTLEKPYDAKGGLRDQLIKLFHGDAAQGNTPGGDVIEDIFNTDSGETGTIETETLPDFVVDDDDSNCQHTYDSKAVTVQAPTCTEWGIVGYTCTKCNYVGNKEYTQKASHDYLSNVTELPSCGESYEETLTCTVCGDSKTQISVKKHVSGKKLAVSKPSYEDYGYTLRRCRDCGGEYRTDLSNKLTSTDYFPPIYRSANALEGRCQWLFYRGDNSEAYYQATNLMSDADLANYAAVMQQLADICEAKGIQLQISIWPNKDQVYSEYMPDIAVESEYKRVERLVDYMTENTNVNIIYPINDLIAAKPYWEMYWPLDTHWNNAGAFIGYQAMLKSLGLETTSMVNLPVNIIAPSDSDYKNYVYDGNSSLLYGVKGDLVGIAGVNGANYPQQKNYVVTYRPEVTVYSQVGNNGAGDTRHTTSNGPNDVNFVMLADSYRVMQLTYLERDFTDCFLAHRSSVNNADVIEAVRNADIIVLAAVERLETDILNTAQALIKILSK
ncbi:MAG: hypothetical protein IJY39_10470 [Clostridia bacterium]|nr:hypothetical protein [Clostridia bacterium]